MQAEISKHGILSYSNWAQSPLRETLRGEKTSDKIPDNEGQ
jgi:hypothetical protein